MLTLVFAGDFSYEQPNDNRHMEVRFLNPQSRRCFAAFPRASPARRDGIVSARRDAR